MEENQNISSNNPDISLNYQFKKKDNSSVFNRVLTKMSHIFGGLDYHEMKVRENGDLTYLDETDFDQWEYKMENLGPRLEIWKIRGQEGWEMVQMSDSGNIIWKRKIK